MIHFESHSCGAEPLGEPRNRPKRADPINDNPHDHTARRRSAEPVGELLTKGVELKNIDFEVDRMSCAVKRRAQPIEVCIA
jgi:hypothetical protein